MITNPLRDLAVRCAHLEQQLFAVVTTGKALAVALPGYIGPENWNGHIARLIREAQTALAAAELPPLPDSEIHDALPADQEPAVRSLNTSKPDKRS